MPGTRPARAQAEADAALRDRVLQLVERLDDPKPEARDEAQARLIKLGAKILPLLPESTRYASKDRKERLDRVRAALKETADETNTGASKVTIQAKGIRLTEALQQLQRQTGNAITDLREQLGAEVTNPAFDLDLRRSAVPRGARQGRQARRGSAQLLHAATARSASRPGDAARRPPLVQYVGPFRVAFKQLTEVRDLQAGTTAANAQLEVAWEPRLRPDAADAQDADELKIKDDKGKEIKPQVDDGVERGRAPAREPGGRDQPQPRAPPSGRPRSSRASASRPKSRSRPGSRPSASPAWPRRT